VLAVTYQKYGQARLDFQQVVKFWDIATGKEVASPTPPWFDPEVLAVSPDGKTRAVATAGGMTIEFRDLATGQVRGEFRRPPDLTAVGFGPDGRVFTGGPDGTVLAWDPRAVKPPPADRK
jgi:WD40 repeat protein